MNIQKKSDSEPSLGRSLFGFIASLFSYSVLRIRQGFFYSWAFVVWIFTLAEDLKDAMVRRMFWGRSTFYRSAFQFTVGLITFIISIGGLAGRLNLFSQDSFDVLAFPAEQLSDADYLDEGASIQAIVADASLTRGYSVETYIVQRGDTIESIAEKFGISKDTLMWANGIKNENFLRIGQKLEILPINGVKHTVKDGDTLDSIASKYQASVQDIYDINWLESKNIKVGQELLVPNGQMPQPKPVIASTPAPAPYVAPTNVGGGGTGNFVRPCGCGRITNWFSAWHGGVDIAQAGGCTIVAADGGTVTMARWYGAGGLQIMIDHGNGFVTLYAHNSSIYVKEGQKVSRGQAIGYMGCTGRCTGTHLHFGVQKSGIWVNPLTYVPI